MRLIIVGSGVAGVTTARYVAEKAPGVEIVLYTQEHDLYYARPRLVDLIAGRITRDELPFYDPGWYQKRGIVVRLGQRVSAILPDTHEIVLDDGQTEPYDKLVLATGAHCWIPPIAGSDLTGVYTLRTVEDATALMAQAKRARHIVMLGGGLLGLDTASAVHSLGVDVTVVEMLPRLLPRQLDAEGAAILQKIIEDAGIRVITGDVCSQIVGQDRVEQIHLKSGMVLDAQGVVVSAGVRANMELAQAAGLAVNRGVLVSERLQTSDEDIYAVGDVTEFQGVLWSIIPAALAQARVAAAQIVGEQETLYEGIVPSTTLKVSGVDLTSIGEVNPEGDGYTEVRHTRADQGIYKKLVVRQGRVVGAISLGDRSDMRAMNQLVSHATDVSAHLHELFSDDFDLMSLVRR